MVQIWLPLFKMGILGGRFQYLTVRRDEKKTMRFTTFSYLEPLKLMATFQYVTAFSLDSSYRRCRVWYGMVTILWAPCQLVHYCVRHTKCTWPSYFSFCLDKNLFSLNYYLLIQTFQKSFCYFRKMTSLQPPGHRARLSFAVTNHLF